MVKDEINHDFVIMGDFKLYEEAKRYKLFIELFECESALQKHTRTLLYRNPGKSWGFCFCSFELTVFMKNSRDSS